MTRRRLMLAGLAAAVPAAAPAQSAAFVLRLGTDTIAVERFTRGRAELVGELVTRAPVTQRLAYRVTLRSDGTPVTAEFVTKRADGSIPPGRPQVIALVFTRDSVRRELYFADSVQVREFAGARAFPMQLPSYALLELATAWMRQARVDTATIGFVSPVSVAVEPQAIALVGSDSAWVDFFGDPVRLRLDAQGRILGADGGATTFKVGVQRVRSVDLEALVAGFAARDTRGEGFGVASPRDTARAELGRARVLVDYGRPAIRGRTVWGGDLVPRGTVWRLGANAATQLATSADLVLGGAVVPAGRYSLFALLAAPDTLTLIVNRQIGQWGTEYDPTRDLARLPLTRRALAATVERLTVTLTPPGAHGGGAFCVAWDVTEWCTSLAVR